VNSLPDCQTLHLLREDSTLRVTINRPETRNALTAEVVEELTSVADAADADTTLRTIILRGAEGTFCAGGDIKGFKQSFEAAEPKVGERDPIAVNNRKFGNFLIKFNSLPQTVVGVIEGAAFGGGLGLVCITDIAICGADTKFALSETGLGIPPAQIAPFVVQRVGLTTARRIALSGARFDGTHAKEIGLVHFAEPDATAIETRLLEVLTQINRCAPGANAATKKIILDSMSKPLPEVLDWAADAFALQLRGDEGREGVRAFLEKRPASWVEQQG
jgi:isohexenylglutaconyl-CoA hydratase